MVTCLELDNYTVQEAATFTQGRTAALGMEYDCLLLDLALPGGDGLQILADLRAARRAVPVLILTARGSEDDRVRGLRLGADDYVVKPFGCAELAARVEALLRRSGSKVVPSPGRWQLGVVTVDVGTLTVSWSGGHHDLTSQEGDLLRLLAERRATVVPRAELQALLWPTAAVDLHSRALDMAVRRLREKLGPAADALVTVRGLGLRLDGLVAVDDAEPGMGDQQHGGEG